MLGNRHIPGRPGRPSPLSPLPGLELRLPGAPGTLRKSRHTRATWMARSTRFVTCGDTGAQSGQHPAQGHTVGTPQDSNISPPCLLFLVPWRVLNSQARKRRAGAAG